MRRPKFSASTFNSQAMEKLREITRLLFVRSDNIFGFLKHLPSNIPKDLAIWRVLGMLQNFLIIYIFNCLSYSGVQMKRKQCIEGRAGQLE
uniref:Uncharacterized protein n=1 Tax=Caenorhabditis japonica TaxID=281687 RepID=A0A8R1EJ70_CAEJA